MLECSYKLLETFNIHIFYISAIDHAMKLKLSSYVYLPSINEKFPYASNEYSTSGTLFLLFVQQTCPNIARISSVSIVH